MELETVCLLWKDMEKHFKSGSSKASSLAGKETRAFFSASSRLEKCNFWWSLFYSVTQRNLGPV